MTNWSISEPDLKSIFNDHASPLEALAAGDVPALVLRQAFPPAACERLVAKLIEKQLLYDPNYPIPEKFAEAAIPEGYFREGRQSDAAKVWQNASTSGRTRIDIGSSLGYRGSNPDEFFSHAEESRALFRSLFTHDENPVDLLYDSLTALSDGKKAVTAYEPDGRTYGPAIIRAHYGGYEYAPHFDSVRLREKREGFSVFAFEHQFAGVVVLQNTQLDDDTAQSILHHCLWEPDIDPHLRQGTFHDYARKEGIENIKVVLDPGDLYFFNTRGIHEVPGVAGALPRIVLATFIGYSTDRDEMFVWS
jgi:hypothetical protein